MNTRNIALAVALLLATPAALAAQNLTRKQAIDADGEVDVSNVAGFVKVTAWDRAEVELTAVLKGDADELEFAGDNRHLTVKVRRPKSSHGPDEAELTLRVPRGVAVNVQAVSADVTVTDVAGRQRLETVSGEVRTWAFDRDVSARSVSGDVRIETKGGKAPASVNTVSGNVVLQGISGRVDVQAVSGDLNLELGVVDHTRLKTVSGNVQARLALAPSAQLDVETVSGDTRFKLQAPVNAEFDLESFSGSLDACFGPQATRKGKYGPGSELRFRHGDGSAHVQVATLSGDVSFCDR